MLVVSNGVGITPSEYKVRIQRHEDDICFCYQAMRKGMHTADTLYEVLNEIHCVEHLWYKRRGNKEDGHLRRKKQAQDPQVLQGRQRPSRGRRVRALRRVSRRHTLLEHQRPHNDQPSC